MRNCIMKGIKDGTVQDTIDEVRYSFQQGLWNLEPERKRAAAIRKGQGKDIPKKPATATTNMQQLVDIELEYVTPLEKENISVSPYQKFVRYIVEHGCLELLQAAETKIVAVMNDVNRKDNSLEVNLYNNQSNCFDISLDLTFFSVKLSFFIYAL